jgi:glycosyltransferase involved in cell wall biosynthesis
MRILVLTHAFPPMHVQTTPVLLKPMAALTKIGISADVMTVRDFPRGLNRDPELCAYADSIFDNKIYVDDARKGLFPVPSLTGPLRLPDLMAGYGRAMLAALLELDLSRYAAIMTWSPFHSINNVMLQFKARRPEVKWIAQFSDPWANNPLERRWHTKLWNWHFEARMIAAADAIVHSSLYSMNLMARRASDADRSKFLTIGHCYDSALYGDRSAGRSDKIVIRHVGTLFGRRTPEPFFQAIAEMLIRRPELADCLSVELVGKIEAAMLISATAKKLPANLVQVAPEVGYLDSLNLMKAADLLVLIEADVEHNLFVPSKLFDYVGSGTPILGVVPPGASRDVLSSLGGWQAAPGDVEGISRALEQALDHVQTTPDAPWCDEEFRRSLSAEAVALEYKAVIERVVA